MKIFEEKILPQKCFCFFNINLPFPKFQALYLFSSFLEWRYLTCDAILWQTVVSRLQEGYLFVAIHTSSAGQVLAFCMVPSYFRMCCSCVSFSKHYSFPWYDPRFGFWVISLCRLSFEKVHIVFECAKCANTRSCMHKSQLPFETSAHGGWSKIKVSVYVWGSVEDSCLLRIKHLNPVDWSIMCIWQTTYYLCMWMGFVSSDWKKLLLGCNVRWHLLQAVSLIQFKGSENASRLHYKVPFKILIEVSRQYICKAHSVSVLLTVNLLIKVWIPKYTHINTNVQNKICGGFQQQT